MQSRHLQGCSTRLCRLRTDGLTPMSKYWAYRSHAGVYGPSKSSNLSSTESGFTPHCFNVWLGREIGYEPMNRSAVVLWIVSGALFLGSSGSVHCCWRWLKRLLYVDHVGYVWSWIICGLSMESVWRVGRVFSCRVYIDSDCHDSQIWVTACLWQSSRR
jgi:hypothetical protein